ncbi:MAG: flippase-like domain-containing protein [Alphaproteobacteria bacterium]|nr:flippase-like domain-containing protein [Alphaproteobacteria bacterium]
MTDVTSPPPAKKRPFGKFFLIFKIGLSLGLLAYLLRTMPFATLPWERMDPVSMLVAMAVLLPQPWLAGLRWGMIMRGMGLSITLPVAMKTYLAGIFFNAFLPASVGGDAVRAWYATRQGLPVQPVLQSVLADRLMALVALLLMIIGGLPWAWNLVQDRHVVLTLACLAVAGIGGLIFIAFAGYGARQWPGQAWARMLGWLAGAVSSFAGKPAVALRGFPICFAIHVQSCVAVMWIARAFGADVPWQDALILVPPVVLALSLPVSLGGWGMREAAMVAALASIHVPQEVAFATALCFGIVSVLTTLPGLYFWLTARHALRGGA